LVTLNGMAGIEQRSPRGCVCASFLGHEMADRARQFTEQCRDCRPPPFRRGIGKSLQPSMRVRIEPMHRCQKSKTLEKVFRSTCSEVVVPQHDSNYQGQ
jgi:hypothetical protein